MPDGFQRDGGQDGGHSNLLNLQSLAIAMFPLTFLLTHIDDCFSQPLLTGASCCASVLFRKLRGHVDLLCQDRREGDQLRQILLMVTSVGETHTA